MSSTPRNTIKVEDLADVLTGYHFRKKIEPAAAGPRVIQIKDIADDNSLCYDCITQVRPDTIYAKHRLEADDVLFRARGDYNLASVFEPPGPHAAETYVASAHFLVLRPHRESVLARYLAWYINQRIFQAELKKVAEGTAIKAIGKAALAALPVAAPALDVQHRVVELAALAERETALLVALIAQKQRLASEVALRLARGKL